MIDRLQFTKSTSEKQNRLEAMEKFWCSSENILTTHAIDQILLILRRAQDALQRSALPIADMVTIVHSCYNDNDIRSLQQFDRLSELMLAGKNFVLSVREEISSDLIQNLLFNRQNKFEEIDDGIMARASACVHDLLSTLKDQFEERFLEDIRMNQQFYEELSFFRPKSIITSNEINDISVEFMAKLIGINSGLLSQDLRRFPSASRRMHNAIHHEDNTNIDEQEESDVPAVDPYWQLLFDFFAIQRNQLDYPRINEIYQYILALPPSQVDCERSFSIMKIVKGSHRSLLSDDLL